MNWEFGIVSEKALSCLLCHCKRYCLYCLSVCSVGSGPSPAQWEVGTLVGKRWGRKARAIPASRTFTGGRAEKRKEEEEENHSGSRQINQSRFSAFGQPTTVGERPFTRTWMDVIWAKIGSRVNWSKKASSVVWAWKSGLESHHFTTLRRPFFQRMGLRFLSHANLNLEQSIPGSVRNVKADLLV